MFISKHTCEELSAYCVCYNLIDSDNIFSGVDLLRLTREDLIQICGLADGIRLNNALQSK